MEGGDEDTHMKTFIDDSEWRSVGAEAMRVVEGLRNKNARRAAGERPGAQVPRRSGEEALDAAEEGRGRRRCDADATPIVSIIADNLNLDSARFLRAGWQDAGKYCASDPASRQYDRATMRAGRPACIGDSVDSRAAMVILRPKSCARRR